MTKITVPCKLTFRIKGHIKIFLAKKKIKQLKTTKPVLPKKKKKKLIKRVFFKKKEKKKGKKFNEYVSTITLNAND